MGLCQTGELNERIRQLLCNTASIETIIQSNHSLQILMINGEKDQYQQYLEINKNPNKKKVVQTKIMQFHFSGNFEKSSIANMPLSVLTYIMDDRHCTVFLTGS